MTMTFFELCTVYVYKVMPILSPYISLTCLNKDASVLLNVIIIWTGSSVKHFLRILFIFGQYLQQSKKNIRKRKIQILQYHTPLHA